MYFAPETNNLSQSLKKVPVETFRKIMDLKKYLLRQRKDKNIQSLSTTNLEVGSDEAVIDPESYEKSLGGPSDYLKFSELQSKNSKNSKNSKFTFNNFSFLKKEFPESEIGWLNDEIEPGTIIEDPSKISRGIIELKYSDTSSMLDFNNNIEVDGKNQKYKKLKKIWFYLLFLFSYFLEDYVSKKEIQSVFTFEYIKRVLEILFMIITRKLRVNSELTFSDEFFKSFPFLYAKSLTGQFFRLQIKHYMSGVVWAMEKGQPKTYSELCSLKLTEQQKIDFLRPKPFTREFCLKSNFLGTSLAQRKDILDSVNLSCFESLSDLVFMGDYYQRGVNYFFRQKAKIAGVSLGDGSQELLIQL